MLTFCFASFYFLIILTVILFVIGIFGFKIWMFIDALIRPEEKYPQKGPYIKLIWALFIFFADIVGPLTYLILVKLQKYKKQ